MDLKDFKKIELSHFTDAKSVDYLSDDANKLLYLNSTALRVFRDFKKHKALTVPLDMLITDVKKKLIEEKKDIVLVTNAENKVIGTIALHYLEGKSIQKHSDNEGIKIIDMIADTIKVPLSKVNMASYEIIEGVKIGHVLNTLINSDRHHIIVYDKNENGEKFIRGYFSLAFIRRKLGLDLKHVDYDKDKLTNLSKT